MSSDGLLGLIDGARNALSAGDYADASTMFHSAALRSREEHLPDELAYSLRHAAEAELEIGRHEQALADSTEALGIYLLKQNPGPLNIANTKRLIALALEGANRLGEARIHWRDAREIYKSCGIREGVTECDNHLELA